MKTYTKLFTGIAPILLLALMLMPAVSHAQTVQTAYNANLSYGSKGAGVRWLQDFLQENNFLTRLESRFVRGTYWGMTQKALQNYQRSVGIPRTGDYNQTTRAVIQAHLNGGPVTPAPITPGSTAHMNLYAILANNPNFTVMASAIQLTGLTATYGGSGSYTVFAPTNAAFAALPASTASTMFTVDQRSELTSDIKDYIVVGNVTPADLTPGRTFTTVGGKTLTVSSGINGQIMINGVAVNTVGIQGNNGVIYAINGTYGM